MFLTKWEQKKKSVLQIVSWVNMEEGSDMYFLFMKMTYIALYWT